MVLIKDSKPKSISGNYMRVFDNKEPGYLMSRVHSTVISTGNELEKIIKEKTVTGFKKRINKEEAMTGKEFCELLEINYDEILEIRKKNVIGDLSSFLSELIKIEKVKNWFKKNPIP